MDFKKRKMKLILKQNKTGKLQRIWLNDKQVKDCKFVYLDIKLSDKEKILNLAIDLDKGNFEVDDLICEFLIEKPFTKEGLKKLKEVGQHFIKLSESNGGS